MFKLICNENKCANKGIPYYFPEVQESAMCGGCKAAIVPIVMSDAEIAATFDYDYKARPTLAQFTSQVGGNN
jgi:hypothetical protein